MFTKNRRITVVYTPAAAGSENAKLYAIPAGYAVGQIMTRVRRASDGSGTVSLGTSSGATDLATTGNMAVGSTGIKVAMVANIVGYAADGFVWANYTVGSDTVTPIVVVSFTMVKSEVQG